MIILLISVGSSWPFWDEGLLACATLMVVIFSSPCPTRLSGFVWHCLKTRNHFRTCPDFPGTAHFSIVGKHFRDQLRAHLPTVRNAHIRTVFGTPSNHDCKPTLSLRSAFKSSFTRVTLTTAVPVDGPPVQAFYRASKSTSCITCRSHRASYLKAYLKCVRYGLVELNAKLDLHHLFCRALR